MSSRNAKKIWDNLKQRWHHFLVEEDGQSTTEYILILAAVVLIASKFKTEVTRVLDSLLGRVSKKMEDSLDGY